MNSQMQTNSEMWDEVRFRYLADVRKGSLPNSDSMAGFNIEAVPYLTMEYLRGETSEPTLVSDDPERLLAMDDDIILLWDGSNAGEFLRAKRGVVSSTAALVTPKSVDPDFFFWACKGKEGRIRAETIGMGIPHVDGEFLANLQIQLPEPSKQRTCADHLERKTSQLDSLVAENNRLLDLLAEKRRAVITRAVTRGLDRNVPLRNSGTSWLTEIPAHWDTQKFTRAVSIIEGQVDPEVTPYVNWPLIAPNHVESETGRLLFRETAADQGAISGKYKCRANDVIYSKIRPALRKATLAKQDSLCSADMYPLRPENSLQPEYLLYLLLSEPFSLWATIESTRVAMPKINRDALGNIGIPIPPSHEQHAIVRFIENSVCRIDELRNVTNSTIGLLRERRSAIIDGVVTGQIEVEQTQ